MRIYIGTALILSLLYLTTEAQQVGQPLFCHGCVAVLKELHKELKNSSGRKNAVTQSVNNLCKIDKFVSYTFSPPKMIKACNYIVDSHKQELIESLTEFYRKFKTADNLPLQEEFCENTINACEGVRRPTKDSEMKPHGFSVDDAQQQLNDAARRSFTPPADDDFQIPKPPYRATPHEEL
ncbi:uncharacterized protein [Parasteatoda tepidariorum]|uniref:uncharacterized protein n=1 Tax=Parasteatoda tepidariorum TaxID=114398 RepID=UPI001C71E83E|nr:uncharacterized protein LOC107449985 [Parasteatoda tepidariorum]